MGRLTDQIFPPECHEKRQNLDLDGMYEALHQSDHFYAVAMKGHLRHIQVRLDEAMELYDQAEARASSKDLSTLPYVVLLSFRFSTRVLQEATSGTKDAARRTDEALDRVLSSASDTAETALVHDKCRGFHHLVRGDFGEALEVFERAIVECKRVPDRCTSPYICAASAAHELGLYKEARRHYENAELTMAFSGDRFVFAVLITWLLALSTHWGWDGEMNRWTETIRTLECPDATRDYLYERARVLQRTSRVGQFVFA